KTGMLFDEETVMAVCRNIRDFSIKNVIADPVIQSSSGASLLTKNGVDALKKELLPLCGFVTPNIAEAEEICGGGKIETAKDIKNAAREIAALGACKVVITGGHQRSGRVIDTFFDGAEFFETERERIAGEMHGSGCVFSSALCALKALGRGDTEAVEQAGRFTAEEIKKSLKGDLF
ncbi:bifunctional hydroxymethylpyrimidine kinase/phosphomethylpyrimidine kinase, partial [Candidatus Mycalebacterium sp.]